METAEREVGERLAAVTALRRLADRLEDAAVADALAAGWSLTDVGDALGVTKQAVHKRYGKRSREAV